MKSKQQVKVSEILLTLQIESLGADGFLATSKDLPGLLAQGRTVAEAIEIAQDVARKMIDSMLEHHDPLPRALKKQMSKRLGGTSVQVPILVHAS